MTYQINRYAKFSTYIQSNFSFEMDMCYDIVES